MPRRTACTLLAAASAGALAAPTHAQCEPQWLGGHTIPGLGGPVHTSFVWNRPATSPVLVVAGPFITAGDVRASGIALWDGARWEALGEGVPVTGDPNPTTSAYALAEFRGDLIVGGGFTSAGGVPANNIARWDGTQWHALAEGVSGRRWNSRPGVGAMAEYQGHLYVAGIFSEAGDQPAEGLARWDGQNWESLMPGLERRPRGHAAWATQMLVHNGELYLSGDFLSIGGVAAESIARWDGRRWHPLGGGMDRTVYALSPFRGHLAAEGDFTRGSSHYRVSVWDGQQWTGIPGSFTGGQGNSIAAMAESAGDLLVGGRFNFVDGQPADNIVRWDGTRWSGPEGGVNGGVRTIAMMGDDAVLGGYMLRAGRGEGISAQYAARWDGDRWHALSPGTNSIVDAITEHNGQTIIGGNFREVQGVHARYIAASDGQSWAPLGGGMNARVLHLQPYGGDLYAGGHFDLAGGRPVHRLARWDGTQWDNPGTGDGTFVSGMLLFEGELLVGGRVVDSAGATVGNIAAWDGSRWRQIADTSFSVNALGVHKGTIYAASGVEVVRCNGSTWEPIGRVVQALPAPHLRAIASYGQDLYIAGAFSSIDGVQSPSIARWDGLQWHAVDGGLYLFVNALTVYRGELIVAGGIGLVGTTEVNGIARWDGRRWAPLGAGLGRRVDWSGIVHSLHAGRELLVGGNFHTAGPHVASRFARWGCPCYADCDNSGSLDFFDFLCFQNAFLAQDPYADCDGDGRLTLADYHCFQNEFLAGCP